jgi:hypothetical protein
MRLVLSGLKVRGEISREMARNCESPRKWDNSPQSETKPSVFGMPSYQVCGLLGMSLGCNRGVAKSRSMTNQQH